MDLLDKGVATDIHSFKLEITQTELLNLIARLATLASVAPHYPITASGTVLGGMFKTEDGRAQGLSLRVQVINLPKKP